MGILKKFYSIPAAILFAGLVFCLTITTAYATETFQLQENKIKAGLFYNFIKYTTWPEQAFYGEQNKDFQICLLGGDAFDGALDPLQGRTAQQRTINIKVQSQPNNLEYCHAVFIHGSQKNRLSYILSRVKNHPVLMISDMPGFVKNGGMVEFSNSEQQRIELSLNQNAIRDSGLRIGDPLLKLAKTK